MLDNVVLLETQKKNNDLRVKTGVKDTFLNFFLDKIEQRRKNITDVEERENVTARVLNTMPRNVFSPVWRLKGLSSITSCTRA